MNALELADELDKYKGIATRDAATMLRQQHAEIEELKAEATKLVMAEYCTCYKLGYSPLNDYATIK